jgi:hypothetical protein
VTKRIHPAPRIIIEGVKPKRTRRTKAQMTHARLIAKINAEHRAALPAIQARLALVSPEEIRRAERTLWRWEHPRY